MFIDSGDVEFNDQCAELFLKCEMPSLQKLRILNCKMSEKGVEYISKTKCKNLKLF